MDLSSQKRMAAEILKCGASRVKIDADKDSSRKEVNEALTREDIRILIRKGTIRKIQKKGSSRAKAKRNLVQKKRGRRKGAGSRKGSKSAGKKVWIKLVRSQRRLLREMRDSGRIDKKNYRKIYMRIKGGMFRNKKHLMYYLKEHELLKPVEKKSRKKKPKPEPNAKKPVKPAKQKLKEPHGKKKNS